MKQSSKILAVLIVGCLAGCGNAADVTELQLDDETDQTLEAHPKQALDVDGEEALVIDWDIAFPNDEARKSYYEAGHDGFVEKLALDRQLSDPDGDGVHTEPIFPRDQARQISYCISNAFGNKPTVKADIELATKDWQAIADVGFVYKDAEDGACSQTNANVDFAVIPFTHSFYIACGISKLEYGTVATGPRCIISLAPPGTYARGVLQIDYNKFANLTPPSDGLTPRGTMRHEIGHILGFRHEHPWAPNQGGCDENQEIPQRDQGFRRLTDEYPGGTWDQASVMQYPQCNGIAGVDFNFSSLDGTGARSIYGMPPSWYPNVLDMAL